jgi:hypothetical protein
MTDLKSYIDAVRYLPLPAHSKEKILGGTAAELLRIEAEGRGDRTEFSKEA